MTLADYITGHLGRPFAWGEHDCVLFAVGWLEQVTGRDYLGPYKPWSTALEAARKVAGAGGLETLFDAHLTPINPHLAADGDLTLIDGTAYLFSGADVVSVGEHGLVFRSRLDAPRAWRTQAPIAEKES